jgi:hypothetical protein
MQPKPLNPYLVLASSVLLPGTGHVLDGVPHRGLMFLFFIVLLGWVSVNVMPADASFIGRYIGGVFVYGLSVIDSYRLARIKWAQWRFAHQPS